MTQERDRFRVLADVSRVLASSLDFETSLANVARLATPELGAWCIVDLCEPDSACRRIAVVHPDPTKQALARQLANGWPPVRDAPLGAPAVVRTGRSVVMPRVTDDMLVACASDEENLGILRALGIGSLMTVPLVSRGVVLGAITFVTATVGHQYTDSDLALAEDLAGRAALAVDNARLYRDALRRADTERALARAEIGSADSEAARADAERARATAEHARADAVVARTEAEIARRTAASAGQAKAEFLTLMSHELRTPLNAIAGYAELLDLGVRGELTEAQRDDVRRIRRSQRHLMALVNDVLNFVRIEAGAVQFDITDVLVRRLLESAQDIVAPQIAAKGCTFHRRCDGTVLARADPEKAQQVILNLLSNAIKFTPPGGSITLECQVARHAVVVRVTDTGPGIPRDKFDAIFEPFVRIDSSLTRTTEGTGLGLAISRDLARAMGGDLAVDSAPGSGATFKFLMPVADPTAALS